MIFNKPELDTSFTSTGVLFFILAFILGSCICEGMSQRLPIGADEVAIFYRDGWSMDRIALRFGTSKRIVANRLIEAGVKSRGYSERYNTERNRLVVEYLSEWGNQTPYIMGYTMADGSISKDKRGSESVQFSCQIADRSILEGIADELGWPRDEIKEKRNRTQVSLRLHGKPIVSAFEDHGVFQNKSRNNFPFPDMPNNAIPHYIRGVLDGDGCVHHNKEHDRYSVQFLGSEQFIISLRDHLIKETGVNKTSVLPRPGHWCVAWQSISAIRSIFEYLYPNGEYMFLPRKKEKFESILS